MKIAIISNKASLLVTLRKALLLELVSQGHDVIALAPDHDSTTRERLSSIGIQAVDTTMSRTGILPLGEFRAIFELRRLLILHQIEACFSYVVKPVIYGTIAAWLAGVPRRYGSIDGLGYVFSDSGPLTLKWRLVRLVAYTMIRLSSLAIDKLVFLNSDDLEYFVSKGLVSRKKAKLLGAIGVDLSEWKETLFESFPIRFILIGRLLRDKGIAEYINAARIVKSRYPETQFVLMGGLDGNPTSFSPKEVNDWIDEGVVEWIDHGDVAPQLERSHVFVLPSYREGVPQSTQEAMAMGRPVITTDVPGCRETIIDGFNGFMIPVRDADTLAEAMQKFLNNPHLISEMGRNSRCISEKRFDAFKQSAKLVEIMDLNN